jgi:hypothetical protein
LRKPSNRRAVPARKTSLSDSSRLNSDILAASNQTLGPKLPLPGQTTRLEQPRVVWKRFNHCDHEAESLWSAAADQTQRQDDRIGGS